MFKLDTDHFDRKEIDRVTIDGDGWFLVNRNDNTIETLAPSRVTQQAFFLLLGLADEYKMIDRAASLWGAVGDCKLHQWHATPSTYHVGAYGTPPGCKYPYRHIFVIDRTTKDNEPLRVLTILRARPKHWITWSSVTGTSNRKFVKQIYPK